jgi:ribosome-associated toxin RatA of RatAB toxin-antitoxin module
MSKLKVERLVNAPADKIWPVISDVEAYADVAPNLSKAQIISGEGQGMQRRCWDTRGGTWKEECVLWEEGRQYSMKVDTSDYPYPFKKMRGTWGLEEKPNGVLIKMEFEFEPRYGPVGWLMVQPMRVQFNRICEKLLDNWEAQILAQTP